MGGTPRLWVKAGQRPRFSPDGSHIAYYVGNELFASNAVAGGTGVYTGPVAGGSHQRIAPGFAVAMQPIWLPNGKLVFRGYNGPNPAGVKMDWYTATLDGTTPVAGRNEGAIRLPKLRHLEQLRAGQLGRTRHCVRRPVCGSARLVAHAALTGNRPGDRPRGPADGG